MYRCTVNSCYLSFPPSHSGLPYEHCLLVYRYFFPTLLVVLVVAALVLLVVRQVNKLYENVKNEKYVCGYQNMCTSVSLTVGGRGLGTIKVWTEGKYNRLFMQSRKLCVLLIDTC